jgi:tRNA(Arg) A34 adenosine deaminase TadA
MPSLSEVDEIYLRRALDSARESRAAGNHPFGACVVLNGSMLTRAGNNSVPGKGAATEHAELIAAREASRIWSAAELAGATLYSSAEPCAMCAGAIYWAGIGRVVYALGETRLASITGNHPENPTLNLPCRTVFASGQRKTAVEGPFLEDEAANAHADFW